MKQGTYASRMQVRLASSVLTLIFALMAQSGFCQEWSTQFLRIEPGDGTNGQISLCGDCFLSIDAPFRPAGRFVVWPNGTVGINVASDQNALKALLTDNGTAIITGTTLIGTSIDQWVKIPVEKQKNWGLWLDKGVVAQDYAIATPDKWADFVFDSAYRLRSLPEVERFIKANRHLPEIPSADSLKSEGYTMMTMNARFMQKIEELTLYIIDQDKKIKAQQEQIAALNEGLARLEQLMNTNKKAKK